jgi:tRNA splicing ligase
MDCKGFLIAFEKNQDVELAKDFEKLIGKCQFLLNFRLKAKKDIKFKNGVKKSVGYKGFVDHYKPLRMYNEIIVYQSPEETYNEARDLFKPPFENQIIVFILGGPGSGKGTQCEQIVKQFGFEHISSGDLLRDEVKNGTVLGKSLESDMKEGKIVSMVYSYLI